MKKVIIFVVTLLILIGCYNRNYVRTPMENSSYTVGSKLSMPVGAVMLSRESWLKLCWEYWDGLVNGGFKIRCDEDIDRFKQELLYSGRAGSVIRIIYREFKGNESFYLARPAFFQELTYDLGRSNVIVFREFKIKILGADNEQIIFIVEKDQ